MRRREFLSACAASAWLVDALPALESLPADLRVTRLVGFDVICQRSKVAGKNSRLNVHGDQATDRMLRIYTNMGVEGVGSCRANQESAAQLLGKNPLEFYQASERAMRSPLGVGTMPLWDLLGQVTKKPIFELLGGQGAEQVPVYDGSIYFADLLPQYESRWQDRFREEIDMGLALGHRAFKVKIGRGNKWMPRAEGDARDVAVLRTIRQHAGPEILIGIDANNGYDLAGTKRLFGEIGELNIAFAEEMFEEQVEQDLEFKAFLQEQGWQTLVADGETQGNLEVFKPFMEAKAIDVYQADMNRFGFEGILTEAAWAAEQGLQVAPHNWGSLVGFYMQLHVGRAIKNLYRAEHDPLSTPVFSLPGISICDGLANLPDRPGAGLEINEQAFAEQARIRYDLRA